MEDNITEKFALLNLIKALQGLSAPENAPQSAPEESEQKTPVPPPPPLQEYNAMASVLERHEMISNRVKNRK